MQLFRNLLFLTGAITSSAVFAATPKVHVDFVPGTPTFKETALERLEQFLGSQKDLENQCVVIHGFFSKADNQGLALLGGLRANEIFQKIVEHHVPESQIDIRSMGPITREVEYRAKRPGSRSVLSLSPKTQKRCASDRSYVLEGLTNDAQALKLPDDVNLNQVLFRKGSYVLDRQNLAILKKFADQSKANTKPIEVHGYADALGTQVFNVNLSRLRALVVYKHLIRYGIPTGQITVTHHGKGTSVGKAYRRVELLNSPDSSLVAASPAAPTPEPTPQAPIPAPEPVRAPEPVAEPKPLMGLFAGLQSPKSSYSSDIRTGSVFGIEAFSPHGLESRLSLATLSKPKDKDITASINELTLQGGRHWAKALGMSKFSLIYGLGLEAEYWWGSSKYTPTSEKKSGSGLGVGAYANAGLDWKLAGPFHLNGVVSVDAGVAGLSGWGADYRIGLSWEH